MARKKPGVEPIVNLRGKKVALGPLRRDLVPLMHRWMNDFEVTQTLAVGRKPSTLEDQEAWYSARVGSKTERLFHVYRLPDFKPVGNCGLNGIDTQHGLAEFGIVIGEKDCWGKGYGTEACRLLLGYGFEVLGLHTIMLRAFGTNLGAVKAYERAGFKLTGRWREAVVFQGKRYDMIYMDCLASEFRG